jgi:CheY-like chemotaxis protein
MAEGNSSRRLAVVLVVEDDVLLRLATSASLRDAGFEVFEAVNAAEAVRVLNLMAVDAVLADIDLPGQMDGFALAKWIHKRRLDTRVILSSAANRSLTEAVEYASVITKPYVEAELLTLLKRMLTH